ncbi:alpha/beta hydrolase family protein [Stackebrandtia albiflava]|uniref:Alpha/beta hydrolase family protein n=1 Tax=Stackebrandtia albiflava TaxID=406432 RepID=A0A562VA40_9ACTN|nr:alpha/beta hydrolase [Stackebrandtia albiflava]TWJ14760.1 alpha/beta hydrolase family protein [Stackebrandtia albiflava]
MDYAQLMNLDFGRLQAAADALKKAHTDAEKFAETARGKASRVGGGWTGHGTEKPRQALSVQEPQLLQAAEAFRRLSALTTDLRSGLKGYRDRLADYVADMNSRGIVRIDGSGTVTVVDRKRHARPETRAAGLDAQTVRREIDAVIDEANDFDTDMFGRIRGVDAPGAAANFAGGKPAFTPPAGADPTTVRDWWNSLSETDKVDLITSQPDHIGGLDGIPVVDRDRANRLVLDREHREATDLVRGLELEQAKPGADESAVGKQIKAAEKKIAAMRNLYLRLNPEDAPRGERPATGHDLPTYLLKLDTEGRGRAIVALGNPDNSDNVFTYVPGTFARLDKVPNELAKLDRALNHAIKADGDEQTAAILWLGYDAPQNLVTQSPKPDYANAAAGDLSRFAKGLRLTHDTGADFRSTFLGHSYGTTVVGFTARDKGLDADAAIFVGSPGVGVDHASQLRLSPDEVYASRDGFDPIYVARNHFGADPTSPRFGGRTFLSKVPGVTRPGRGHTGYFDANNPALENIGKIVVGDDDITGDRPKPGNGPATTSPAPG